MEKSLRLDRRDVFRLSSAGIAAALAVSARTPAHAQAPERTVEVKAEEHWAMKGPVKLYLYRKHAPAAGVSDGAPLFLVHGSTLSSRGSFDVQVPGRLSYSAMDYFAARGFDVWTMDHEGYGYSDRTKGSAGILSGVEDLKAALSLVEQVTSKTSVMMYGVSSGAIRAGAFANAEPARVTRLILNAFTYTGKDAPEIERRRQQVDVYRKNSRRPLGIAQIRNIFERDGHSDVESEVVDAVATYEIQFGDSVPTGTYLDMATNLPMVDPTKLTCPVCLIRPEHDGNATEEELYDFFARLATKEKQFVMLKGQSHAGGMVGRQRARVLQVIGAFLTMPGASA